MRTLQFAVNLSYAQSQHVSLTARVCCIIDHNDIKAIECYPYL